MAGATSCWNICKSARRTIFMNKTIILGLIGVFFLNSCKKEATINTQNEKQKAALVLSAERKEQLLSKFASVLSKASFENENIRSFLKKEALKQFDKNYDVLYYLVKDELVKDKSFRDELIAYSSEETIAEIENSLPLLNILVPSIPMFGIKPEDLDVTDREIPVAVAREKATTLYFEGKEEVNIAKGEVPAFHVFVVNENSRVEAPVVLPATKSTAAKSVVFKFTNYSYNHLKNFIKVKSLAPASSVGNKAIEAFSYYNSQDSCSIYSMLRQRDYIYHGIKPGDAWGGTNEAVSEYIGFIEVDPAAYFKIADQNNDQIPYNDPQLKHQDQYRYRKPYSEQELIDKMWTQGAYDFRFEIYRTRGNRPQVIFMPFRPQDLWNFNTQTSYRHGTWIRRKKWTYKVDPHNFTAKRVDLASDVISMGKWDLKEEGLTRLVSIYEQDLGEIKEEEFTFEALELTGANFYGNIRYNTPIICGDGGTKTTNTVKKTNQIKVKINSDSDELAFRIPINYYDPVITKQVGDAYEVKTYGSDYIKFGIYVK